MLRHCTSLAPPHSTEWEAYYFVFFSLIQLMKSSQWNRNNFICLRKRGHPHELEMQIGQRLKIYFWYEQMNRNNDFQFLGFSRTLSVSLYFWNFFCDFYPELLLVSLAGLLWYRHSFERGRRIFFLISILTFMRHFIVCETYLLCAGGFCGVSSANTLI